jgi:hypothetical protein
MKKALEILNLKLVEQVLNPENREKLYEAISELEDLQSRSCENCYESKTCKILHSVYKDRLKKEGYAMHKNEFKCGFWHSLF